MIKLIRTSDIPNILLTKGEKKKKTYCNSFNRSSKKYIDGSKKFEFDSKIYGDSSVKNELKKAQHDKCAFCESKVTDISYGDVEHFRPKAGFINEKGKLQRPGYYWLAYEWTNLLFSCQICNQKYKKNFFPLLDTNSRAKTPKDDITQEKTVFINPYEENPEKYIGFNKEVPYGKDKRGSKNIKLLGLNRDELNESRRKTYQMLKAIYILANASSDPSKGINQSDIKDAQDLLEELTSDDGQYLLMSNTAIKDKFC